MGFRFRKSSKLGPFRLTMTHRRLTGRVGGSGLSYQLFGTGKRRGRKTASGNTSQGSGFTLGRAFVGLVVLLVLGGILSKSKEEDDSAATIAPPPAVSPPVVDFNSAPPPAVTRATPSVSAPSALLSKAEPEALASASSQAKVEPENRLADDVRLPESVSPPDVVRTWRSATGKFTVDAVLVDAAGGMAFLKWDGNVRPISSANLCSADQEYIRGLYPYQVLRGKSFAITDADTFTLIDDKNIQHKVRLEGIDAPEKKQSLSFKSTSALASKINRKSIRVEWIKLDPEGRKIGQVFVGDKWINREILAEGWAWHFKKYNHSEVLAAAETAARDAKLGIWAQMSREAPWDYRANQKSVTSAEDDEFAAAARSRPRRITPKPAPSRRRYDPPVSFYSPPSLSSPSHSSSSKVHVKGYFRKDGTYVSPHTRSAPRR